jgi:tetratricopeptide (TPR) repeat protein
MLAEDSKQEGAVLRMQLPSPASRTTVDSTCLTTARFAPAVRRLLSRHAIQARPVRAARPALKCGPRLHRSARVASLVVAVLFVSSMRSGGPSAAQGGSRGSVSTSPVGGYQIHILNNQDPSQPTGNPRSVLLLGLDSDRQSVSDASNYINPSTGKRFDVVIGLGTSGLNDVSRVLTDHFSADQNAAALRTAIDKQFGGPLEAETLYTHSNGTTVGVASVLRGTFTNVKEVDILGPDVGYGNQYVNPTAFAGLKGAGVQTVNIYRNSLDVVPAIGSITADLGSAVTGTLAATVASRAVEGVEALHSVATAASSASLPTVNTYDVQTQFGSQLNVYSNHIAEHYLTSVAAFKGDPRVVVPTVGQGVGPTDAKGVRIAIEDDVLAKALGTATPAEDQVLFGKLAAGFHGRTLDPGRERALVEFSDALKLRFAHDRKSLAVPHPVMVSLKMLSSRAAPYRDDWAALPDSIRHPGPMSRIRGYVVLPEQDDVVLVGDKVPGEASIDIDDLIVGARSVWKDGGVPFCSLDPNPTDFAGPQSVRVSGVPGASGFALKMLEADYLMKRMLLGLEPVAVQTYRSYRSIIAEYPQKPSFNRFWLFPVQPEAGDIETSVDGRTALFQSGTQILTEQMKSTEDGLVGIGSVESAAEEAAAGLTADYDEIAKTHSAFQELQGLFDIVLAARLWRYNSVHSGALEALVRLPYTPVSVPTSYSGLKVEIQKTDHGIFVLGGGVHARTAPTHKAMISVDDPELGELRDEADRVARGATPVLSALMVIPPERQRRNAAQVSFAAAGRKLSAGDIEGARQALTEVVRAQSLDPEPIAIRSLVDLMAHDTQAARADALSAGSLDPEDPKIIDITSRVLFECDLLDGNPDAAMRRIDAAIKGDPVSATSRVRRAEALIELGRTAEARDELASAVQIDPTSALALSRLGALQVSEGWLVTGRRMVERASALAAMSGQSIPEIRVSLAAATLASAFYGNAKLQIDEATRYADAALVDRTCDVRSAVGALIVLTGAAMLRGDWDKADEYATRARNLAPLNPGPSIAAAEVALALARTDLARKYLEQAQKVAPRHPMVVSFATRIAGR